jgi:3-methyladenine DNA glycosylase AlkC
MTTQTIRYGFVLAAIVCLAAPGMLRAEEAPADEVQKLIQALQNPDAIVRLRAAKSLGEMGAKAQPAVEALKKALADEDEDVRLVAKRSLERIQVQSSPELTKLIADLKDPDALNRLRAAKTLGDLGSKAAPALPALEQALKDDDEDVKRVARHAIDKIQASGSPEVHQLIEKLKDEDALVRLSAAKRLGDMGAAAAPAIEALRAAREDADEVVRMVVKNALKKLEASGQVVVDQGGADLTAAVDKITITKVERIFNAPETTAGGFLSRAGSMRFFVTVKNTAQHPIQIGTMRVHWFLGQDEIHSNDVDGPILPLLAGQESIHTFALRWDRDSRWDGRSKATVEVILATPLDLDKADQAKLEAVKRELAGLHILNPKPIYSFGILMGDQFTLQNTNSQIAKGVLIALHGYDVTNEWIVSQLYYAPLVPKGFTQVTNNPSKPAGSRRVAVKLVDYQHAKKSNPQVKRFEGIILGVGLEEDELPK